MPDGNGSLDPIVSGLKGVLNKMFKENGIVELKDVNLDMDVCEVEEVIDECKDRFKRVQDLISEVTQLRSVKGKEQELEGKLRELEEAVEEFEGCQGGLVVLGRYDCKEARITLYLSCFEMVGCKTKSFLARRVAETLAHALIHHLQFNAKHKALKMGGKGKFSVLVDLGGKCNGTPYGEVPYPYRPHEAEAFKRQEELAGQLLRRKDVREKLEKLAEELARRLG